MLRNTRSFSHVRVLAYSASIAAFIFWQGNAAAAQSTSQDFPTPTASAEISGTIAPRDIGDSRLTTYYYSIDTGTGDLFINVQTHNFTGDIDVFTLNGLQPLAKIVLYADLGESETGRVVYLRKPEKLLLRIQGRTPGDEAATYRIKFAGSFVASMNSGGRDEPPLPRVTAREEGTERVNSVGTIIARPAEPSAPRRVTERAEAPTAKEEPRPEAKVASRKEKETEPNPAVRVPEKIVGNSKREAPEPAAPKKPVEVARNPSSKKSPANQVERRAEEEKVEPLRKSKERRRAESEERRTEPKVDPLANIRLVVSFKDGTRLERPMSEVLKFSVDKGVLTVIAKDGSIGRYSILEVAKLTVE